MTDKPPPIGDNLRPLITVEIIDKDHAALLAEIKTMIEAAARTPAEITSDEESGKVSDLVAAAIALGKKVDTTHTPVLRAGREKTR